jgi:aminopeptidase
LISREDLEKCAETIVKGMDLHRGEAVVIQGGSHAQELLEEIGVRCYMIGVHPLIIAPSDDYVARIYKEVSTETLEVTPKHLLGAISEADARIVVEPLRNPQIRVGFPREKIAARTRAHIPIRKLLHGEDTGRGKKWTYAGWPTPEAAQYYQIKYEDLERLIIQGIKVSPETLKRETARLAKHLKGRDWLHVTDEKGTDFTCRIKDRRINEDDGIVDEQDVNNNDLGNNLPAGEVFVPPHELYGDGQLVCPITKDRLTGQLVKNVELHFKNGRLLLDKCKAEVGGDTMIDSFKRCIKIDSKEGLERTANISELGIGCNPAIDKAIGYILTDEKVAGSIHVAFGSNFSYGGTSKSCMHWDFVSHPTATIETTDTNEVIMKHGNII